VSEKYIIITDEHGERFTSSIHDFLADIRFPLGLDSRVEYVGITKNPEIRPTDGKHSGLTATLHRLADECRDTLIYFNLFKVFSMSGDGSILFNVSVANAMNDHIDVEIEADILEKCFIFYFDAAGQDKNRKHELSELRNNLKQMSEKRNVTRIHVHYEFQEYSDYGVFSSTAVQSAARHIFTLLIAENEVKMIDERGKVKNLV